MKFRKRKDEGVLGDEAEIKLAQEADDYELRKRVGRIMIHLDIDAEDAIKQIRELNERLEKMEEEETEWGELYD